MKRGFCGYKYRTLFITASFSAIIEYILLFTDKMIIGNIVGENAFSATDMITPLFSIVLFLSTVIADETSNRHSYFMGQMNRDRANECFGEGVILAVAAGVLTLFLAMAGKGFYFQFLGISDSLVVYANDYYKYYQFIVLFYPFYALLSKCIFTDGDELIYGIAVVARLGSNAVISILLCRSMGIAGAGIGTLISTALSLCILFLHFKRRKNSISFQRFFNWKDVVEIAHSGITGAMIYLYQAVLIFILSKFIVTRIGENYLSVLSVVTSVIAINSVFDSITQAARPLCFVYMGEGNEKKIRHVMSLATRTAVIFGVVATAFFLVFSSYVVRLMDIQNVALAESATQAVRIVASSLVFISVVYVIFSYYVMVGKNKTAVIISGLREIAIPLIVAIPLGLIIGINGIWIGFAVSPLLTLLVCVFVIQRQNSVKDLSLIPEEAADGIVESYDLILSTDEIHDVRDKVANLLKKNDVCSRTINYVMLMIEEVFMVVLEKNYNKTIYAETTVRIDEENVQLILRDSGIIFDVTDADMNISSMRVFVVSSIMEHQDEKMHFITTSYNRNAFRFPKQ